MLQNDCSIKKRKSLVRNEGMINLNVVKWEH